MNADRLLTVLATWHGYVPLSVELLLAVATPLLLLAYEVVKAVDSKSPWLRRLRVVTAPLVLLFAFAMTLRLAAILHFG